MKWLRLCILFCLCTAACEEKVDLPLDSGNTDLLVVDGVLTNELRNHVIKLSRPYGEQNGEPEPVSGAAVFIFEDTVATMLTEFPTGSGSYYTPARRAVFGKTYTLIIRHAGKNYFAQDGSVPVEPLPTLQYRAVGDEYALTFNGSGDDPYYVEYLVDWQNTPTCSDTGGCDARLMFYDLKTVDVNEIYKPERAPFTFPAGSLVIRRKYSVSPRYKAFLRSMLSETEWRGGVFDVQRSDVITNLSAGAVGFFAVCSVVSDSTLIE